MRQECVFTTVHVTAPGSGYLLAKRWQHDTDRSSSERGRRATQYNGAQTRSPPAFGAPRQPASSPKWQRFPLPSPTPFPPPASDHLPVCPCCRTLPPSSPISPPLISSLNLATYPFSHLPVNVSTLLTARTCPPSHHSCRRHHHHHHHLLYTQQLRGRACHLRPNPHNPFNPLPYRPTPTDSTPRYSRATHHNTCQATNRQTCTQERLPACLHARHHHRPPLPPSSPPPLPPRTN